MIKTRANNQGEEKMAGQFTKVRFTTEKKPSAKFKGRNQTEQSRSGSNLRGYGTTEFKGKQ
jgi:hypothetical protein